MTEKEKFIKWMQNKWSESTIKAYSSKIDKISKDLISLSAITKSSLWEYNDNFELEQLYQKWISDPKIKKEDLNAKNQNSNSFKRFIEFREYEKKLGINEEENLIEQTKENETYIFALEEHLQDFLIKNLSTIKQHKLKLFEDKKTHRKGKEFPTDVGFIDILTVDEKGNFYVFETKLSKGADKALGQLLRYMGWVKINLAKNKEVYGIIVANKMDEKIKYAVEITPNISLCEYEMNFDIKFLNRK